MSNQGNLINLKDPKSLMDLLKNPIEISRLIAGVLASNMSEHTLAAGRIIAAAIKQQLLCQLGEEIKNYIAKGIIKENYLGTSKEQTALVELFKFIDEEVPDEERFKAMKSIFFVSLAQQTLETDRTLAYECLKIGSQLNSGELMVLKAAYDIYKWNNVNETITEKYPSSAEVWHISISRQIGHNLPSLVDLHENKLINLRLIADKIQPNRRGIGRKETCRLTELGIKFCEFIIKY